MIIYVWLFTSAVFVFIAALSFALFFTQGSHLHTRRISSYLWSLWKQAVPKHDEKWDTLLRKAGKPFNWGKAEWLALQFCLGIVFFVLTLIWLHATGMSSFTIFWLVLISGFGFMLPKIALKRWANYREEKLSVDIARFINRYVNLLENHVPPYFAMVKAARPTRLLKHYTPSLSEWNRNRLEALDQFKQDLGVDEAVILVSHMRTIEQLSADVIAQTMQRLEYMVDNRRLFRHRKKIKSLGIGYSIIVYPAFYIGLIVAMFPWYKLLAEILDKYLV